MFRSLTSAASAVALLLTAAAVCQAGDSTEGVARVTDPAIMPVNCPSCPEGCPSYSECPPYGCPSYGCPGGGCRSCPFAALCYGWNDGFCGFGQSGCGCGDPIGDHLRCLFGCFGGCSHAPGEGYVTPSRRPIWDLSMPISHMWSGQWTCGKGGAHPSTLPNVYMPTDTTQLGYSYSHVPYWMPKAGMTPPLPIPGNFHNRTCFGCNGSALPGTVGAPISVGSTPVVGAAPKATDGAIDIAAPILPETN